MIPLARVEGNDEAIRRICANKGPSTAKIFTLKRLNAQNSPKIIQKMN